MTKLIPRTRIQGRETASETGKGGGTTKTSENGETNAVSFIESLESEKINAVVLLAKNN